MSSLVVQTVKHLPAMRETQFRSLGQEDPWQKEMATHSSTLAWKISWMEELIRLGRSQGLREGGGECRGGWAVGRPLIPVHRAPRTEKILLSP